MSHLVIAEVNFLPHKINSYKFTDLQYLTKF